MGAQTGAVTDPAQLQMIRRRQEDTLNQAGRVSMFPDTEPGLRTHNKKQAPLWIEKGLILAQVVHVVTD
jgi:hypothetical protein